MISYELSHSPYIRHTPEVAYVQRLKYVGKLQEKMAMCFLSNCIFCIIYFFCWGGALIYNSAPSWKLACYGPDGRLYKPYTSMSLWLFILQHFLYEKNELKSSFPKKRVHSFFDMERRKLTTTKKTCSQITCKILH